MKFYDDTKLHLFRNRCLWSWPGSCTTAVACDNTTCQKDMVPDNIILCPIAFASKSLTGQSKDTATSRERYWAYYMAWKNFIIIVLAERYSSSLTTNHWCPCLKKMSLATLLQCIQHILLKIHQYRVQIIYKPGPKIFIADWLSQHNHVEGKDKPIKDMDIKDRCHTECYRHPGVCVHITNTTGICTG